MILSSLHENLAKLGFTKEESEFYVFLYSIGPGTARTIARRFNINRVKAYRTLKDLEEKGLVVRTMERPVRFTAQPIDGVLNDKIHETKEALQDIEANKSKILEDLKKIKDQNISTISDPIFRIYQGRQQIYDLISGMCNRVKNEIRIVTTSTDFRRLRLWGLDDRFVNLTNQGIKVSILTEINESNIKDVEEIQDDLEIRHLSVPSSVRVVTMDNTEVITSVAMDDTMSMTTTNDTGLWTNALGFTATTQIFYDALWNDAPDSHVYITSIKTGIKPQELISIRTNEEYANYYLSLIEHSEESIDIMVNKLQDLPFPIGKLLVQAPTRKIRILTQVETSMSSVLQQAISLADIRHNEKETEFSILIVDDKVNLLRVSGSSTSIHAVWSNLIDYTQTISLIFEDYWAKSLPADSRFRELMLVQNRFEMAQSLKDSLSDAGWSVEVPGSLVGEDGLVHGFDLIAKNDYRVIAVNLVVDGDGFNQLFELSSKKMNLIGVELVLGSIRELQEEVVRMSALYGIHMIQDIDINVLSEKILKI